MMLATFNPANFSSITEAKRDSMCSLISVNSQMSLDFLVTPETVLDNLDFDEASTMLASNESSPMKEKLASLDVEDDGDMPSRKRRASHLREPTFKPDEMLANLGDSSSSLFQANDFLPGSFDMEILDDLNVEIPTDVHQQNEMDAVPERGRTQSSERRRIQSELLARLECLDGIELPEDPEPMPEQTVVIENDGKPRSEQPEPRLGIYNEKQRIDRLNAYREKRKQRVYGRVRYVLRQKVSETRPRVKGRFVKQTGDSGNSPQSVRDHDSSTSASPASSLDSPVRRVEFRMEPQESPAPKRGRSAWEMLKNLALLSPIRPASSKTAKDKRPSLPATFSERLLTLRRKSTTAASTASGKARRRFSRDEFFDEIDETTIPQEPDRKRATSLKKWDN